MSGYLHAEVEQIKRSVVTVDIAKFLNSEWSQDRAAFDGTDEEFVIECLHEIGAFELLDPCEEDEQGIAVKGDFDDSEIRMQRRVPA